MCEYIGLIGEVIISMFEFFDFMVDIFYWFVRVGWFGGVNYFIKIFL